MSTADADAAAGSAAGAAGDLVELMVGPVAHGGHCVARLEGRVVFVRHALPGERVVARLTQAGDRDRYWRADAVEVLDESADRVPSRCALARPGGCGGCDWQHVSIAGQRALLGTVVREQLARLGGVQWPDLVVEPVPGDADGLGWRTRVRFTIDAAGRAGLRGHRSHDVVPVEHCPIAHPEVDAVGAGTRRWPGTAAIDVVAAVRSDGPGVEGPVVERLVVIEPATPDGRAQLPPLPVEASLARRGADGVQRIRGRAWVSERVLVDGAVREFRVGGAGFWQVHPGAAQTLLGAVLAAAAPAAGERAVDLYCGVGLFCAGLALRVGPTGSVVGVEGDERTVRDARRSLHDLRGVELVAGRVERVLVARPDVLAGADVVVLDPPRTGAGRAVLAAVLAAGPRVVVYVACDPAALARDVATAAANGYRLAGLRAFAMFPMTHHVECVATLVPA